MPKLSWSNIGDRFYETGIDRGVMYPVSGPGVAWNGLIAVREQAMGGESRPYYQDGVKRINNASSEEFGAIIEAYTYPDEFAECDGTTSFGRGLSVDNQPRKSFGFSYRTRIGNDLDSTDHGYKIHLVYNALVAPTDREYSSISDSTDVANFSWPITTTPIDIHGKKASAHLVIDSTKCDPYLLESVEELLYGTGSAQPTLPSPQQIISLFENWVTVQVVDHGDGTWTASGPDPVVRFTSDTEFIISWHTANPIDAISYTVSTG